MAQPSAVRLALALLLAFSSCSLALAATPPKAEWHISNTGAWEDESCDTVCKNHDQRCTETCWPATVQGLKFAMEAESPNPCSSVETGPAAAWQPAKDPETTVCYWLTDSSYLRCPEKPTTLPTQAAVGKFLRRLCPCVPASALVADARGNTPAVDCGLGANNALPAPTSPRPDASTTPAPAPTPAASAPAPGVAGAPAPTPRPTPAANAPTLTPAPTPLPGPPASATKRDCQTLCVAGFTLADARLNGQLTPVGSVGALSHWLHLTTRNIILAQSAGHWHFMEGTTPWSATPVASARSAVAASVEIPVDDFYDTAMGGAQASFTCCSTSASPLAGAAAGQASSEDAAVPVVTVVVVLLLAASLTGCIIYVRRRKAARARAGRKPDGKLPPHGDIFVQVEQDAMLPSTIAQSPPQGLAPTVPPRGASSRSLAFSDQPMVLPRKASPFTIPTAPAHGEDRAANAVAAVLGRSSVPELGPGGVYEGPLTPWWENGVGGGSSSGSSALQVGSRVRLRSMTQDPSWNGAEGEIEDVSSRTGLFQIRLPDGRVKSVRAECCELADRPASWGAGARGGRSAQQPPAGASRPGTHSGGAAAGAKGAASTPSPSAAARSAALAAARQDAQAHPIDKWEAALAQPMGEAVGEGTVPSWLRSTAGGPSGRQLPPLGGVTGGGGGGGGRPSAPALLPGATMRESEDFPAQRRQGSWHEGSAVSQSPPMHGRGGRHARENNFRKTWSGQGPSRLDYKSSPSLLGGP